MQAKRLFAFVQLLFILLIVFFLSAILSSRVILKGEMISVPDITGKTLDEAKRELGRKHLALAESGVEFSDRWEKGRILLQEPSPGSKIRTNKPVKVVLSGGSEMVDVPPLVGKSLEAASRILAEIGLERGKISQIHTSRYAAGRIIAQAPSPSPEKVKRLTSICFLVSQGELEQKYVMPDLIEKKSAPTIARLRELGFKVSDVRYSFYPGREPGIIIKQFPPHGYAIAKRNLITLEVSR